MSDSTGDTQTNTRKRSLPDDLYQVLYPILSIRELRQLTETDAPKQYKIQKEIRKRNKILLQSALTFYSDPMGFSGFRGLCFLRLTNEHNTQLDEQKYESSAVFLSIDAVNDGNYHEIAVYHLPKYPIACECFLDTEKKSRRKAELPSRIQSLIHSSYEVYTLSPDTSSQVPYTRRGIRLDAHEQHVNRIIDEFKYNGIHNITQTFARFRIDLLNADV